jgi:hypothetical protein
MVPKVLRHAASTAGHTSPCGRICRLYPKYNVGFAPHSEDCITTTLPASWTACVRSVNLYQMHLMSHQQLGVWARQLRRSGHKLLRVWRLSSCSTKAHHPSATTLWSCCSCYVCQGMACHQGQHSRARSRRCDTVWDLGRRSSSRLPGCSRTRAASAALSRLPCLLRPSPGPPPRPAPAGRCCRCWAGPCDSRGVQLVVVDMMCTTMQHGDTMDRTQTWHNSGGHSMPCAGMSTYCACWSMRHVVA